MQGKSVHFIPTFRISYTFTCLLDRELFGWGIFYLSFRNIQMKSLNLWIIFLGVFNAKLCVSQHTCPQISINATTEDEEYYKKDLEFAFEGILLVIVGVAGIFGNVAIVVMFAR